MRISLTKKEISQGYNGVKKLAQTALNEGDIDKALDYIHHCAVLAQQFNWIYSDDELEEMLESVGRKVVETPLIGFRPIEGRVVFYDAFCKSFVLALQYVRALISAGKEILYITTANVTRKNKFSNILDDLSKYSSVRVVIVPKGKRVERMRFFFDEVIAFAPEQLLIHSTALTDVFPALYVFPNTIKRYLINLADQAFWLGKNAIDYCIEFRQFGVSVSQQRRGISPAQQLLVPFYPVDDGNPFEGFPVECTSDKVIVFSGGDMYKVLDEKRTYWKLVKSILDKHPNVIFLFATKIDRGYSREINEFIKDNGFEGRFIYVKYRKDINEVFRHCDIYMGTCPASGSLMSQLAAVNAKPILQYYYPETPDDETEQVICYNDKFSISFYDEELFLEEAHRLVTDVDYRNNQGQRLKSAMITQEQFDKLVLDTLSTNVSQVVLAPYEINYTVLDNRWLALEKKGYVDTMSYIWGVLGTKYIRRHMPSVFIKKQLKTILKS